MQNIWRFQFLQCEDFPFFHLSFRPLVKLQKLFEDITLSSGKLDFEIKML